MLKKRKICIVTGARAEYGILYWLLKEIQNDSGLELQLVVTGTHLLAPFGLTYHDIEGDGFQIDFKIKISMGDSTVEATKAMGQATIGFADAFAKLSPDIVVLQGDRFEILSAAAAATIARIPIAHIHGGESTLGAFDDSIRHSITKMALLHFTSAEPYRKRVIQMGEDPRRVFSFGAPGLDHLDHMEERAFLSRDKLKMALKKRTDLSFDSLLFLITYHPVTLENGKSRGYVEELLKAMDAFPEAQCIFTGSNADPDHQVIGKRIQEFVKKNPKSSFFLTLGSLRYLSLLQYVDVVIGNSSSGIIEVPSFHKPTVNIGDRQTGRLMADSVICCDEDAASIESSIRKALDPDFRKGLTTVQNPYRSGNASSRIKETLKSFPLEEGCLKKEFYEL